MLSRVAKVVWWLGLLIALIGTYTYAWRAYELKDCAGTLHLLAEVDNANTVLLKQYIREHPEKSEIDVLLGRDAPEDKRDTPELRARAKACESPNDWTGLALGWVLALLLWSFCYILGGSFWLPGKSRI